MSQMRATVFRKEPDGNGLVRLESTTGGDSNDFGLLDARTENYGRIWNVLKIGSPVNVEVERSTRQGYLPKVTWIGLVS